MKLDHIETIIFDFDGTIANTLELGVEISNSISKRYRYKKIRNNTELDFYRNLPTQQALRAIGISILKLPFVAASFRKKLAKKIHLLKPIDGIVEVIKTLSNNYTIGIVTSNSRKNTLDFVNRNGLYDHVDYYSTGIGLFQKYSTIKSLMIKNNIDGSRTLLIGDETRDIEAARKCNLPIASVCWGFHTSSALKKFNPDFILNEPTELIELLH